MFARFDQSGRSIEVTNLVNPEYESDYVAVPDGVSGPILFLENGVVRPATSEEFAAMAAQAAADFMASEARVERNRLLRTSDVLVLADRWAAYTAAQKTALSTYRQALRDVPMQAGFPATIDWPVAPSI